MPFVDIYSDDDYASIFYFTNAAFGNIGGFDEKRPTVIMLHPFFLDSSWMQNQFGDPRLYDNYNLIAFDMRTTGKSLAKPSSRHDSWVDAADLALCHMKLRLPKCHILAHDSNSVNTALRFAFLFPDMCSTLTLCNIPSQTELSWVFSAYEEMIERWCFPADIETLELAGKEAVRFMIGPDCESDLLDDILAYWQQSWAPKYRQRVLETLQLALHRQALTPEIFDQIRMPVLIVHGDRNDLTPLKFAEELQQKLTGTDAIMYALKGASGSLSTLQGNASIVTQVFTKFVGRQPAAPTLPLPPLDVRGRMLEALHKLADVFDSKHHANIASRDPMSPLSFCMLPPEIIQKQEEQLTAYGKDLDKAFDPLGPDGRPLRKYSEREGGHWFSGNIDGISYAGNIAHNSKQKVESHEKPLPIPQSEPMTDLVVQQSRHRRGTVGPSSVDKNVIKGSMAKVVSSTSSTSIGRLMK